MPHLLLSIAIGYLLGSIPFAYLIARAWGVDIFTVGTRNPGAANVYRQVGPVPGTLVFLLDMAKAAAAVGVAYLIVPIGPPCDDLQILRFGLCKPEFDPEFLILPGLAAILGHWYPIFLKFRGGAGLAAAIGTSLAMLPIAGGAAIAAGLLVQWRFKSTGHSALAGLTVYLAVGANLDEWRMALVSSTTFAAVFAYYLVASFRRKRRKNLLTS